MTNRNKINVANNILKTINNIYLFPNSVIVYDIDNTLIDEKGLPISSIIQTYNYAKSIGLTPVIITARPFTQESIITTNIQLTNNGITGYKYIFFRNENYQDIYMFKLNTRKYLHQRGYNVVASIGDMYWDIGDYGGFGFIV